MLRRKNIFFVSIFFVLVTQYAPTGLAKEKPLPTACITQCKTPYGEVLGIGIGNVRAYSNCSAACVVNAPNIINGTFTGIKWQCVEYARRWLLRNKGVVYGDVDVAADIWNLNFVTRVKDKTRFKLSTYANGNKTQPRVGDLLIYAKAYLKTGHVAVVSSVNSKAQTVQVIEENYNNTKWPGDYARSIHYVKQDKKFWLLDSYLLGWKHVTNQTLNSIDKYDGSSPVH